MLGHFRSMLPTPVLTFSCNLTSWIKSISCWRGFRLTDPWISGSEWFNPMWMSGSIGTLPLKIEVLRGLCDLLKQFQREFSHWLQQMCVSRRIINSQLNEANSLWKESILAITVWIMTDPSCLILNKWGLTVIEYLHWILDNFWINSMLVNLLENLTEFDALIPQLNLSEEWGDGSLWPSLGA